MGYDERAEIEGRDDYQGDYPDRSDDRRKLNGVDVHAFVFAGNSTFTLVSRVTGVRFTFKVSVPKFDANDPKADTKLTGPWFVKVLQGPNNEEDFGFLGTVFDDRPVKGARKYFHWAGGRISRDAPSAKAAAWFFNTVLPAQNFSEVEVWHEGKCGRCGRKLTVPSSIENGLGPVCAELG